MGFDPRRWRPSPGGPTITANVEALLAENDALRREVRSLRAQLELLLQGRPAGGAWSPPQADRSAPGSRRAAAPRSRVPTGGSHGLGSDLVERWGQALARHPAWSDLRIGPPGGLRALVEDLRRHSWNPRLSLEEDLDRRSPGLGSELAEALRGPHSRVRWAVRAAFALYGPRAMEWLSEEPLRVVVELRQRIAQLEHPPAGGAAGTRRGTRTANTSGSDGPAADPWPAGAAGQGDQGRQRRGPGQSGGHGASQEQRHRDAGGGHRRQGSRPEPAVPGPDTHRHALALLGLEAGATPPAIKRAYRRLAKAHHPDLGGDAEAFRRLEAAYRLLIAR